MTKSEIKVFLERQNKQEKVKLEKELTIDELMQKLNIISSEVIPVKNGELVTPSSMVKAGDEIKFLAVISGG